MGYRYGYYRRGLYRSRRGMILGVFKGIADYFDLPVTALRVAGVIGLIVTGILPLVPIYLLAALIMRPEPVASCGIEW